MPLSPINMFRSTETPLAQLLQGQGSITHIMDSAIQIGRDLSNKQLAQEHDLLGMRQNEAALAQRRGEALQQNNEDAQRFAREAFQSDRNFGLAQDAQARTATNDAFSQDMQTKHLGLAVDAGNRADHQLTDSEAKTKYLQDQAAAQQEALRVSGGGAPRSAVPAGSSDNVSVGGPGSGGVDKNGMWNDGSAPSSTATPQTLFGNGSSSSSNPNTVVGRGMAQMTSVDTPTSPTPINTLLTPQTQGTVAPTDLNTELKAATLQLSSATEYAKKHGDPEGLVAKATARYGAAKTALANVPKPATAGQQNTLARQKSSDEEKAMQQLVLGDQTAFKPQKLSGQQLTDRAGKNGNTETPPTASELTAAEEYDKNLFISEKATASRMTLSQYVSKGGDGSPGSPNAQSIAARTKFWKYANLGAAAPTASAATDTSLPPFMDAYKP